MGIVRVVSLALVSMIAAAPFSASAQDAQTPADFCAVAQVEDPSNRTFTQAEQVLEAGVDYRAVLCTSAGPVYVDLLEDYAPVTVNNFVFLAEQGYYNNTTFHRVIEGFMAQGGDPTGTGSGGPGYQFQDEFVGFLNFDRSGWLAMANANNPEQGIVGTNGSQFFITTVPTSHLDYRHTIFGEVLEGQETVDAIPPRDPQAAAEPGTALNTVIIVTDPSTVTTTYATTTPATAEEILAGFELLRAELPEDLVFDEEHSGIFTTEQVSSLATPETQAAYAEFLTAHSHLFRVANLITNASCDLSRLPFMSVGYTVDAFATPEDATAAMSDAFMTGMPATMGLSTTAESDVLPGTVYSAEITTCDSPATRALTFWQRGRFVVTAEVTYPADAPFDADLMLSEFVGVSVYERALADVLRREIR